MFWDIKWCFQGSSLLSKSGFLVLFVHISPDFPGLASPEDVSPFSGMEPRHLCVVKAPPSDSDESKHRRLGCVPEHGLSISGVEDLGDLYCEKAPLS